MPNVGNGTISWSLNPRPWSGGNQADAAKERSNYLMSANSPIRYQVIYKRTAPPMNADEAPITGDVVNVIYNIYGTSAPYGVSPTAKMEKIATIRKSRDIAYKTFGGIYALTPSTYQEGHRFTIDISSICSDLLSYSLVPIGKGTFAHDGIGTNNNLMGQRGTWGGMNGGGHPQDNDFTTYTSNMTKLTQNGAYRMIKVVAEFELLQADGSVSIATNSQGGHIQANDENWIVVINSVPQWEEDAVYYLGGVWNSYTSYFFNRYASTRYSFLTKCPNFSNSSTSSASITKDVRVTDEAEWLYFWIYRLYANYTYNPTTLTSFGDKIMLEVRTDAGAVVYLNDFETLLKRPFNQNIEQTKYCAQNVSPSFIANNAKDSTGAPAATPFSGSNEFYSVRYVSRRSSDLVIVGGSQYRHFKIDRETEHPFGYVRFHWLNRMGGIDSYTAKRDVVESISVDKSTFESKSPDKLWLQQDSLILLDDSVRGDLYRGGREVLNVSANRNHSVFTEPLNKSMAKWLEELITSPNVWIEHESEATKRRNNQVIFLRPSTKTYIPIVITNSDVETVNQESGLVKFNIEFTHSHPINTQRN